MKDLKNKSINEIWSIINQYNDFLVKLNKETYYSIVKTNKLLKDIKEKRINDYHDIARLLKIQIYSIKLTLEDINSKIIEFMEEENE